MVESMALLRQSPLAAGSDLSAGSKVASFYAGRSVMITGATGFMGKVLVEKLLRSCPQVGRIYLLMRTKRGQDPKARLNDLLSAKLFDHLRSADPKSFEKLVSISADVMEPGMGISEKDELELIENVSVVFHAAATVKFDEALKVSINMNVQGTQRVVALCQKMKKLAALVHVSTAYCNCDRHEIDEIVYPPPHDPEKVIEAMCWMEDDLVTEITPRLVGNRPNTYTYTKALAEAVLVKDAKNLPVAIVRPSIVAAAWKEPLAGWVDNFNGATGLFVGVGKGLVRSIYCHREMRADLVPVDVSINLLIAVGWYTAEKSPRDLLVYNCASGEVNPIRWGEIETWGHALTHQFPFDGVLWYPSSSFKSSSFLHKCACALLHYLPAYLIDLGLKLAGKKPKMYNICAKFSRALKTLEYFTTHEWVFKSQNVPMLLSSMSATDRKLFDFDLKPLQWYAYLTTYFLGARAFALKEDPSDMPLARARLKMMYWLHVISRSAAILVAVRFVLRRSAKFRSIWYYVVTHVMHLQKLLSSAAS